MKTVAILLYTDVLLLDVAGPAEVFSIANRYLPLESHYRLVTVGVSDELIRASNGFRCKADYSANQVQDRLDILLVPGGPGAYNGRHPDLNAWLREAVLESPCYGSICTGAFILGGSGLLDGRRVTTHWNYTERLAKAYPDAMVETDQIFIRDEHMITSGGVTAGIDLALSIVAEDHGRQVALDVAKVLLVAMRRQGGQAQFSPLLAESRKDDTPVSKVQQYVLGHLNEDLTVEKMAELVSMSSRHFSRLFTREVNLPPMTFVQNARVDHARKLLETSQLPLKTIAYESGFCSPRQMRNLFREKLGLSPDQYRRQFSF